MDLPESLGSDDRRAEGLIALGDGSRRNFLLGSALATVCATVSFDPAQAEDVPKGRRTYNQSFYPAPDATKVEVSIDIIWSDDGSPVTNATIYDAKTNTLLGGTDAKGHATVMAKEGDVLRLVDNVYGMQSTLKTVQGNRVFARDVKVMATGELWVRGAK